MITVGIPTLSCFDLLDRAVLLYRQSPLVSRIVIIDNSGGKCLPVKGAELIVQEQNILSRSWNWLFDNADDPLLIANDDVFINEQTLPLLLKAYEEHPEHGLFYAEVEPSNMFSFFLLRHSTYRTVGRFDEGFKPAYFEDCDYGYRMNMLGITTYEVPGCSYEHVGSATLKRKSKEEELVHHMTFMLNHGRYCAKWGGEPGKERYTRPFNTKP